MMCLGVEHQNFFEGRATTYMKAGMRGDVGKELSLLM